MELGPRRGGTSVALRRRLAPWVALGLASLAAGAAADGLRLIVEAPPEMAAIARQVEGLPAERLRPALELTGLADPGPPIWIVIAPEGSAVARSAPPWISGWAAGASGTVVLLPGRVPRYPDHSLDELVEHEITHVLVARAARGRTVPRWFDEGLAMAASRSWDLEDRTRLTLAVMIDGRLSLADLDHAFAGGEREVTVAYALARDLVEDLLERHGNGLAGAVLAGLARDESFESAFARASGRTLAEAEAAYWRRRTFWSRWLPLLTSSAVLWIGVTLLALLAIQRRRARDARL